MDTVEGASAHGPPQAGDDPQAPYVQYVRELGCSRCRYAATGCSRCRNPTFRPRTLAPPGELRQAVAVQRAAHRRTRRLHRIEQRRQAAEHTSTHARGSLLDRIRRQLGKGEVSIESPRPVLPTRSRRRSDDTLLEQPPHKYRRIVPSHEEATPEAGNKRNDHQKPPSPGVLSNDGVIGMDLDDAHGGNAGGVVHEGKVGHKRGFMEQLQDTIERRRHARRSSSEFSSEVSQGGLEAFLTPRSPKRRKHNVAGTGIGTGTSPDPRLTVWEPPVSPFGLLEEELYENPWKILVACMLLNKTSGAQVRKVIWELFNLCPTPAAAVAADTETIQNLIQPLGLFRKRAMAIQRLSHEYLTRDWRDPMELYGVGKYGADAYKIFCRGKWRAGEVEPDDKDLQRYVEWCRRTGGLGTGGVRHITCGPV